MTGATVIIGASGHGREVASCIRALSASDASWRGDLSFLDDDSRLWGNRVGDLSVLGGVELLERQSFRAVLGVGYPAVKRRILRVTRDKAAAWPVIVDRQATIGDRTTLGLGTFVQARCVLTVDVTVGEFVTLNVAATVNHDCSIGPLATLCPGVHIGGNVRIEEGAFIGIGASVIQGITIGAWSVVGAGAAVVDDVPPNAVVAGCPARVITMKQPGWQDE